MCCKSIVSETSNILLHLRPERITIFNFYIAVEYMKCFCHIEAGTSSFFVQLCAYVLALL